MKIQKSFFCFVFVFFAFFSVLPIFCNSPVWEIDSTLAAGWQSASNKTSVWEIDSTLVAGLQSASNKTSVWEIVTTGSPVIAPIKTSYGFAYFNDGRMVTAISDNGVKLFEKRLKSKPSDLVTFTENDFFYAISSTKKTLTYYNPDGLSLWAVDFEQEIIDFPIIGFDGRVIVHSKKSAYCFGLNGKLKWKLDFFDDDYGNVSKSDILGDGSIIFYYEKVQNQKTKAVRVSPYGQMLEDITFSGIIIDSLSAKDGVLLLFNDGTVGLCSVKNNKAFSEWTFSNAISYKSAEKAKLFANEDYLLILSCTGEYSLLNIKSHNQVFYKNDKKFICNSEDNFSVFFDNSKFTILCKNQKKLYAFGINYFGTILFFAEESLSENEYGFYTENGFLVFIKNDWTVSGFLPYQSVQKNDSKNYISRKKYPSFIQKNLDFNKTKIQIADYKNVLLSNNYGQDEEYILDYIKSEIQSFLEKEATKEIVFDYGSFDLIAPSSINDIMTLARLSEVDFSSEIAQIIQVSSDVSVLKAAFLYASYNGFDPYHSMINAIENKFLTNKTSIKDDYFYIGLCDAVYNICKTMGSPVLYNQGKNILTKLLVLNYTNQVKNYILQTVNKIIDLQ